MIVDQRGKADCSFECFLVKYMLYIDGFKGMGCGVFTIT